MSAAGVESYYRDLEDRLRKLGDDLLAAKDATNGTFDIYVSHMSHRTNNIMKVLTIVSTMLLPTSVILRVLRHEQPAERPVPDDAAGFVLMLVSILIVSLGTLSIFRHQGWL